MIKDILTEEFISTNETAKDWREAVRICGDLLQKHGKTTDEYTHSMIAAIEEYGPYVIMLPEIALFHGRPSEGVREICMSLVTFTEPVYFPEFGDKNIKAAFAFGAVDSDSHVALLSKMAEMLQNQTFLKMLRNNGEKADILSMIEKY